MNSNKFNRLIALTIATLILLLFPIFSNIYYVTLYYAVLMVFLPIGIYRIVCDKKFEKKFYERWGKVRKQGFCINLVRESLRSLLVMTTIVIVSQFFGNHRTPLEIVSKLSSSSLLWIIFLLLAFSLVAGIAAWYGNEKRYSRIYYNIEFEKNKALFNNKLGR